MASMPNHEIAGYVIDKCIGKGSFGSVFKGVRASAPSTLEALQLLNSLDVDEPNIVAVKIVRVTQSDDSKPRDDTAREISILKSLRHKNIVHLYKVEFDIRDADLLYMIMEYCSGGDLKSLIKSRGRLSDHLARKLFEDLACGVEFLWNNNLVHRDIKPPNLLLSEVLPSDWLRTNMQRSPAAPAPSSCILKIADFGLSRHLHAKNLAETYCGSPLYMAPEILQGLRYDGKADLWSVGVVLFEMMTGATPFAGSTETELLSKMQSNGIRQISNARLSSECNELLSSLLVCDPKDRCSHEGFFTSARAFCNSAFTDMADDAVVEITSLSITESDVAKFKLMEEHDSSFSGNASNSRSNRNGDDLHEGATCLGNEGDLFLQSAILADTASNGPKWIFPDIESFGSFRDNSSQLEVVQNQSTQLRRIGVKFCKSLAWSILLSAILIYSSSVIVRWDAGSSRASSFSTEPPEVTRNDGVDSHFDGTSFRHVTRFAKDHVTEPLRHYFAALVRATHSFKNNLLTLEHKRDVEMQIIHSFGVIADNKNYSTDIDSMDKERRLSGMVTRDVEGLKSIFKDELRKFSFSERLEKLELDFNLLNSRLHDNADSSAFPSILQRPSRSVSYDSNACAIGLSLCDDNSYKEFAPQGSQHITPVDDGKEFNTRGTCTDAEMTNNGPCKEQPLYSPDCAFFRGEANQHKERKEKSQVRGVLRSVEWFVAYLGIVLAYFCSERGRGRREESGSEPFCTSSVFIITDDKRRLKKQYVKTEKL